MKTPIHSHEKKAFIFWFLNQHQMKLRESNWILTYLANHNKLLRNVHFVRNAKFCPRGIIISSKDSDDVPFRFYRNQLVTTDAEKAFHDIRLNQFEPLYIELNFYQWNQSPQYAAVLEENPFLSDDYFITNEDREETEHITNYMLQLYRKDELVIAIDQTLDDRNQEKFIELSEELQRLNEHLNNQPIH